MSIHLQVPTPLLGEAVWYLWITCNDYANYIGQSCYCMKHILHKNSYVLYIQLTKFSRHHPSQLKHISEIGSNFVFRCWNQPMDHKIVSKYSTPWSKPYRSTIKSVPHVSPTCSQHCLCYFLRNSPATSGMLQLIYKHPSHKAHLCISCYVPTVTKKFSNKSGKN